MKTTSLNMQKNQSINLIDGSFSPSDAKDIVVALLNEKINYHKIKRLSITEGNLEDDCLYDSTRIDQLLEAKQKAINFFHELQGTNTFLEIDSTLTIKVKEKSSLN